MKKSLVVFAFALIAASLIAPKFIATKYQEKLAELVKNLDEAPGYTANIESMESTWFGSEAKILVAYDMAQMDPTLQDGKLEAELIIDTHYGPLLFNEKGIVGLYSSQIRYLGDKQRSLLSWDEEQALYQMSLLGDFTGKIQMTDSIPAFNNQSQTFRFGGYTGQGEKNDDEITFQGVITEINMNGAGAPISAKDIRLSTDLDADLASLLSSSFYDSDTNMTIGIINVGSMTKLEGFTFSMGSKLDNDTQLGSISIGYLIKNLVFSGYEASDLALLTEFNQLNNQFFKKYADFSNNVLQQTSAPDVLAEELLTFVQENIDEFLVTKPEFNVIEFSGIMQQGRFEASLTSKLADMDTPSIEQFLIPEFWLYNAIVKADIEADDSLVKVLAENYLALQMRAPVDSPDVKQQAQMIINHFVQQGLIKQQDDKYLSEIKIEDGQGQINEQIFPLM